MGTVRFFSAIGIVFAIFLVIQVLAEDDEEYDEKYEALDDVQKVLYKTPSIEVPQKSKLNLGYDAYRIDKPDDKSSTRFSYTFQYRKGGPKTTLKVNPETIHFTRTKKDNQ